MIGEEAKLKKRVKALLREHGFATITIPVENAVGYYNMPVPSGMGIPMLDFVCCYKSFFFMIETKAPGNELSAQQRLTCDAVVQAGGAVIVDDDFECLKLKLENLLAVFDNNLIPLRRTR